MSTAGLVLAAGAARRLGRPKHLLERGGRSYAALAVGALRCGGCDGPVLVVLRPGAALAPDCRAEVLQNRAADQGMGSSLRAGLAALAARADVDAVVVTLVDTPHVGPEHVRRLRHAACPPPPPHPAATMRGRRSPRAAVATYAGAARTPVLLQRDTWAGVSQGAVGDIGARAWLTAHPALVVGVECGDLGPWADVDVPADLAAPGGAHDRARGGRDRDRGGA